MNKTEFIQQLRKTAEELKPLTESASPGSRVWDGIEYAKNTESREPDPHALAWWAILNTIAELIEAQECALSSKQTEYIQQTLFGGMGSLNDLNFDVKGSPSVAARVNQRLAKQRGLLFAAFTAVEPTERKLKIGSGIKS